MWRQRMNWCYLFSACGGAGNFAGILSPTRSARYMPGQSEVGERSAEVQRTTCQERSSLPAPSVQACPSGAWRTCLAERPP